MAALRKAQHYLGLAAAVATILALLVTVLATFFPGWINDVTSSLAGPIDRTPTGTVRPDYVTNQIHVFFYASALVVLITAFIMGTAYHWSSAASAGSVAAGRGKVRWLKYATISCPVVLALIMGIYLPRAVFQPTNEEELARQFFFGAWALRSVLGGVVMGLFYVLFAGLVAFAGFFLLVQLRRSIQLGRYERQIES